MQTIDSQMLDLALIQKVLILNFIDHFFKYKHVSAQK